MGFIGVTGFLIGVLVGVQYRAQGLGFIGLKEVGVWTPVLILV